MRLARDCMGQRGRMPTHAFYQLLHQGPEAVPDVLLCCGRYLEAQHIEAHLAGSTARVGRWLTAGRSRACWRWVMRLWKAAASAATEINVPAAISHSTLLLDELTP